MPTSKWDEGYETIVQDGRRHGFTGSITVPVDRRLVLSATGGYEWLELGPHAPGGRQYAGRRGTWAVRAEWTALKRDSAYMGYGFRDETLWAEQLVPIDLGFWGEIGGERYIRPNGFIILNPTERSLYERLGIFYNQAISPHIGINTEAYIGQDPLRDIRFGDAYGLTLRLTVLLNTRVKLWAGYGYESSSTRMESGGGPDSYLSFGMNANF